MKGADVRKLTFRKPGATESMTGLRDRCLEVFDQFCDGKLPPDQLKEIANMAGKIISSAKVQVEYSIARKEKPEIPFLK